MSEKKVAKVFKSTMPFLRMIAAKKEVVFQGGRAIVSDAKVAEYLEAEIAAGNRFIFIDPNEKETTDLPPGSDEELKQKQLQEFLAAQNARLAPSSTAPGNFTPASTADSPTTGGRSAPAPRFTAADAKKLLETKAQANPAPSN